MVKHEKLHLSKPLIIILSALGVIIIALAVILIISLSTRSQKFAALPAPEPTTGVRGDEFGVDKNINESTIDQYLGRDDVVYRDLRMLKDPGNYAAIGGDSYLSGYIDGFEITPLPYILAVEDLPEEVGDTYTGPTLFYIDEDGEYVPNYEESFRILDNLFPDDKAIFLMCGGGGYADKLRTMLIDLGWDEDKIYNVGGYWNYDGDHNVPVKYTVNNTDYYAFWKVPYHQIDFSQLHEIMPGSTVYVETENSDDTNIDSDSE